MNTQIDATTRLGAVIGTPISHSLSPLIYNTAFQHEQLNAVYLGFDTDESSTLERIQALQNLNVLGINVTMPGKEIAMQAVDQLDDVSQYVHAVNTITKINGQWHGFNTDGAGFWDSVEAEGIDLANKTICLFGSGGTTRVILAEAVLRNIQSITLIARQLERPLKIKKLIQQLSKDFPHVSIHLIDLNNDTQVKSCLARTDIVINSTSVGMNSSQSIIKDPTWLSSSSVVCDVVYQPLETQLLQDAQAQGCQTVQGLGMLIHQAKLNYKHFTQQEFPLKVVETAILNQLN